jgi:hypothetical protein
MRVILFSIAALILALPLGAAPAGAQRGYPWCAYYSTRGGMSCSFSTFEQCREEISGVGGMCSPNPSVGNGRTRTFRGGRSSRRAAQSAGYWRGWQ